MIDTRHQRHGASLAANSGSLLRGAPNHRKSSTATLCFGLWRGTNKMAGSFAPPIYRRRRKARGSVQNPVGGRRKRPMRRPKRVTYWKKSQTGGWSYAEGTKTVEHSCKTCGLLTFRREYSCLTFFKPSWGGKPKILTKFARGQHGKELPINNPCICVRNGHLTNRILKLMAKGHKPASLPAYIEL